MKTILALALSLLLLFSSCAPQQVPQESPAPPAEEEQAEQKNPSPEEEKPVEYPHIPTLHEEMTTGLTQEEQQAILKKYNKEKSRSKFPQLLEEQKRLQQEGKLNDDNRLYWTEGEVYVTIQGGYTALGYVFEEEDFPELEGQIESFQRHLLENKVVEWKEKHRDKGTDTPPPGQGLVIVLKDKSAEAMIAVCETLLEREEVRDAGPQYKIGNPSAID